MSVRTVSVELKAKVDDYKAGVTEAATATEVLDQKVEATDRDLKKIPPDAVKAAAALKAMGVESGRTALQLEDIDTKTGKAGTSMGMLETKLADARVEVRKLADEFNRTGNSDSLTKLFKADDAVKELEKLQSMLTPALKKQGVQAGSAFDQGFLGALGEIGTAAAPVLVPVLAALIAQIGADIGGGTLGVVGLGGLFTGALLQAKTDPQVKAAASGFGTWLLGQLGQASAPFAQPLLTGLDELKADLKPALAELGKDFAYLAPYVSQFAMYLGAAAEKFMPGFSRAIQASGPILTELGHGMVYVADGLNIFLDEISKGGKGEVEALDTLFRALGLTLAGLGFIIRGLSAVWDGYVQVLDAGTGALARMSGVIGTMTNPLIGDGLKKIHQYVDGIAHSFDDSGAHSEVLGRSLIDISGAAATASDQFAALKSQLGKVNESGDMVAGAMTDKLFASLMNLDQATLGFAEAQTKLGDALQQNGRALDIHTTKGQANREAVLAAVQANIRMYDTNIASGMSAADAASAYDSNTAALERQLKKAGLAQQEIDGLIGKYRGVPGKVDTDIAVNGLTEAINDLDTLLRQINGLHSKSITIQEHVYTYQDPSQTYHGFRGGGIMHYAQGGVSTAAEAGIYPDSLGPIVQFAEPGTGKEGYLPMQGISRSRAASILAEEASWYGYGLSDRTAVGGGWRSASAPGGGGAGSLRVELAVTSAGNSGLATLLMGMVRNKELTLAVNGVPVKVGP